MQLRDQLTAQSALGTVLFSDATASAEGTLETMRLVRQALAYLESRYRHQVTERHRQLEEKHDKPPPATNGGTAPRKKAGGGRRKQAAAAAPPAQPAMFDPPGTPMVGGVPLMPAPALLQQGNGGAGQ